MSQTSVFDAHLEDTVLNTLHKVDTFNDLFKYSFIHVFVALRKSNQTWYFQKEQLDRCSFLQS